MKATFSLRTMQGPLSDQAGKVNGHSWPRINVTLSSVRLCKVHSLSRQSE